MKNENLEKIIQDIRDGKEVSPIKNELAHAYQSSQNLMFDRICWDNPFRSDVEAIELAQTLSLAGINELYVTKCG